MRRPLKCREVEAASGQLLSNFAFLDTRGLTDLIAKVVQAAAAYDAALADFDTFDARAVHQKRFLDADAMRDTADRDRGARAAALANGDDAFEHLRAFFSAFDHFGKHLDRIAGAKLRDRFLELVPIKGIDDVHGAFYSKKGSGRLKTRPVT